MQIKQFVPPGYCKKCDVCCRFLDDEMPLAPVGLSLISYQDRFICCNFDPAANRCKDYKNRPLDCQLYPFVVMWDEDYRNVVLGIDHKCPYLEKFQIPNPKFHLGAEHLSDKYLPRDRVPREQVPRDEVGARQINSKSQIPNKFQKYKNYLPAALRNIEPQYILRFQDDIEILERLDVKVESALNKLLIGDKVLFEKYASQNDRPVSSYSFVANYIWTGLLDYYWTIIDGNFCLFCKTKDTIFMPIPPIPPRRWNRFPPTRWALVKRCFELMNEVNKNKNCSRIEDISIQDVKFFKDLGFEIKEKGCEYVYRQKDLVNLAGDRYKAKRALCNYFEKNYKFKYRDFRREDKEECLRLFKRWKADRTQTYKDDYYKALLTDSLLAHKKAMDRFQDLELAGRVVVVDEGIEAYTFGYQLNEETFVILFEVADLKLKGLAQFIFREFCREQARFKYINAMDDSGLETLKKVKMSYHPFKIEKTFCVYE